MQMPQLEGGSTHIVYLSTCIICIKLWKCWKHRQNIKDPTVNTLISVLSWVDLSCHFGLEVLCMKSRGSSNLWAQEMAPESRILMGLALAFG